MEKKLVRTDIKTWKIRNNEWGDLLQKNLNEGCNSNGNKQLDERKNNKKYI